MTEQKDTRIQQLYEQPVILVRDIEHTFDCMKILTRPIQINQLDHAATYNWLIPDVVHRESQKRATKLYNLTRHELGEELSSRELGFFGSAKRNYVNPDNLTLYAAPYYKTTGRAK